MLAPSGQRPRGLSSNDLVHSNGRNAHRIRNVLHGNPCKKRTEDRYISCGLFCLPGSGVSFWRSRILCHGVLKRVLCFWLDCRYCFLWELC